jgi:hypothetical protein
VRSEAGLARALTPPPGCTCNSEAFKDCAAGRAGGLTSPPGFNFKARSGSGNTDRSVRSEGRGRDKPPPPGFRARSASCSSEAFKDCEVWSGGLTPPLCFWACGMSRSSEVFKDCEGKAGGPSSPSGFRPRLAMRFAKAFKESLPGWRPDPVARFQGSRCLSQLRQGLRGPGGGHAIAAGFQGSQSRSSEMFKDCEGRAGDLTSQPGFRARSASRSSEVFKKSC